MKQEILSLLQNNNLSDRLANRQLGCWLAWHEGYGTLDIFSKLTKEENLVEPQSKFWSNMFTYSTKQSQWRVGDYILQITCNNTLNYDGKIIKTKNTFIIATEGEKVNRRKPKALVIKKNIINVDEKGSAYF